MSLTSGLVGLPIAAALAACSADSVADRQPAGRYQLTAAEGCSPADPTFELWPHANGMLSLAGYDVLLENDGSGTYTGQSGTCVPEPTPYLVYQSVRVEHTSSTTVHVVTAAAQQPVPPQQTCIPSDAFALAPGMTTCTFDGTLLERAPHVSSLSPSVITRSDCTQSLVFEGGEFTPDVRVGYEMDGIASYPATENCPSGWSDTDGMTVCNLVVERRAPDRIVAHLDANSWAPYACFPAGTLQLVIENPKLDGSVGVAATSALEAYVTLELMD